MLKTMPSPPNSSVRTQKISEVVASRLRAKIIRHELVEGEQLQPESMLMAEFGISRPSLREALRILESEGLLITRQGSRSGPRICTPKREVVARYTGLYLQYYQATVSDVISARSTIELSAVESLISNPNEDALALIRGSAEAEQMYRGHDLEHLLMLADNFHRDLMNSSTNVTMRLFGGIVDDIVVKIQTLPSFLINRSERTDRRMEHLHLVELISQRDGGQAYEHWKSHVKDMELFANSMFGSSRVVDVLGLED